jgi:hypothetical protein
MTPGSLRFARDDDRGSKGGLGAPARRSNGTRPRRHRPHVSDISSANTRYKPLVPAELKLLAGPGTIETSDGLTLAQYSPK